MVLRRSQKEDTGPAQATFCLLGELGREASRLASMDGAAAGHGEDNSEASMISPGPHRAPSPASRVHITSGRCTHVVRNQHHPQLSEHTTPRVLGRFVRPLPTPTLAQHAEQAVLEHGSPWRKSAPLHGLLKMRSHPSLLHLCRWDSHS